ncbi:MAG: hypothetical protein FWF92_11815 [Oscillospiraceae bacterium]|nr:hypothetical protein [Oscillospiraceae bacterium]
MNKNKIEININKVNLLCKLGREPAAVQRPTQTDKTRDWLEESDFHCCSE